MESAAWHGWTGAPLLLVRCSYFCMLVIELHCILEWQISRWFWAHVYARGPALVRFELRMAFALACWGWDCMSILVSLLLRAGCTL